jgi:hypothetical protein
VTEGPAPKAPTTTLDHLVVAATTLADGIEYIAEIAGVTPQPGGKHAAMGTHNALVRLSERTYLEIIAIDPEGTCPSRPRWFGLDGIALQAELTERPRLIHWVARTTEIVQRAAACPVALGPVHYGPGIYGCGTDTAAILLVAAGDNADRIRNEAGIPTIAVGAIFEADHANSIIAAGRADLCAIARPHLANPAWTLAEAAKILKGKKVKVRTIVIPATTEIYKKCLILIKMIVFILKNDCFLKHTHTKHEVFPPTVRLDQVSLK